MPEITGTRRVASTATRRDMPFFVGLDERRSMLSYEPVTQDDGMIAVTNRTEMRQYGG
jgi:hypothetical protein